VNAFQRRGTVVFAVLSLGLGVALIVRTASEGGGTVGFVMGVLFVVLGCGRLYLWRRS
jgi:hypothetical protein